MKGKTDKGRKECVMQYRRDLNGRKDEQTHERAERGRVQRKSTEKYEKKLLGAMAK